MARRKKKALPQLLLWDRRQQSRFIQGVERLVSLVNDLDVLIGDRKRRGEAARKANETRKRNAAEPGSAERNGVPHDEPSMFTKEAGE